MKYVTTLQVLTEQDPTGYSLTDFVEQGEDRTIVNRMVREGATPALALLEVINIGLAGRAIQVRLPDGQTAFLTLPQEEQVKVIGAIKAAI